MEDDSLIIENVDSILDINESLLDPDINPDKTNELNEVLNNHINDTILLFNLQNKFNNYISTKVEHKLNTNISDSLSESSLELSSESNIILKKLEQINNNQIILNNKIEKYQFYNSIWIGIGIIGIMYRVVPNLRTLLKKSS
jgi:hypothetical protein